jgi:hypothetical protein
MLGFAACAFTLPATACGGGGAATFCAKTMCAVPTNQAFGLSQDPEFRRGHQALNGNRAQITGKKSRWGWLFGLSCDMGAGKGGNSVQQTQKNSQMGCTDGIGLLGGKPEAIVLAVKLEKRMIAFQNQLKTARISGKFGLFGGIVAKLRNPIERIGGIAQSRGAFLSGESLILCHSAVLPFDQGRAV